MVLPKVFKRRRSYNLKGNSLVLGGLPISGFADGDALTVTWAEDVWTTQVGATGEVQRSRNNNNTAEATIRIQQTSAMNVVLGGLLKRDQLSGDAPFAFLYRDPASGEIVSSPTAWVKRRPEVAAAAEAGAREWVLELIDADLNYA